MFKKILNRKQNEEEIDRKNKMEMDLSFLSKIQSQGGVVFKDKYVQKGDGYEACIKLWTYPTTVNVLWLEPITSQYDVIVVQDIATMNKGEIVDSINKSMLEHDIRYRSSKDESDRRDAQNSYNEMLSLYDQISEMGEVVKLINIRLFVHAPTLDELDKKIGNLEMELTSRNFRGQVFLNETKWDWESLFLPYEDQLKLPNGKEGKGIPAMSLASGLPYNFSDLNDKNGSYIGTSTTGGNVIYDLFHKDKQRRYYNGVVVGTMGAGKSTLLKKITMDNIARGNYIRGFDVTGEFETLISENGGQSISLDGSQGVINPLQIYQTTDESVDIDEDKVSNLSDEELRLKNEELSFMKHVSKVTTFYSFLAGQSSSEEIEEFKRIVRLFYDSLGFFERMKTTGVTSLKNDEYPIFSDFYEFVCGELYEDVERKIIRKELSDSRINRLEKIELIVGNIVSNNAHLFNGHTTLPDITHEQIVFFSVRNLTSLEKNIENAQMYNALNLIWDNLIQIGTPQMKAIYEDKTFREDDAKRLLLIIDEAHRFINSENMLAVSFLTDFSREARKYFGGFLYASQSIRDFVPDHSDSETVTKIRTLFELTQYKFVMQQDTNTLDALRRIFEGKVSESELSQIPTFEQGDCLLSINSVGNLMLKVEASDEELALFRGGM